MFEQPTWDGDIKTPDGAMMLFARVELADHEDGVVRLHPGFAEALGLLRLSFRSPMIVTSCCRSAAHNQDVGGHPRSLHVYDAPLHEGQRGTLAIDIGWRAGRYMRDLVYLAIKNGWSVGVAETFVHLDLGILSVSSPACSVTAPELPVRAS